MTPPTTPPEPTIKRAGDEPDDFQIAVQAVTRVVRAINAGERGGDGAEFIAHLAATVAANLGSTDALTQGRPGSWEAAKVGDLVRSTVGYDDEYLMTYRTEPIEVVVNPELELDDIGWWKTYQASIDHLGTQLFGDRYFLTRTETHPVWGTVQIQRGHLTVEELEQLDPIEERLWELQDADRAEYQERFTATVLDELNRRRSEQPGVYPAALTVNVRFTDDYDDLTDTWDGLAGHLYEHARTNTPLPGSDTPPDHSLGQEHADTLLTEGHWPHLRIPELAHYGTPAIPNDQEN